jgi:hypothetical protein
MINKSQLLKVLKDYHHSIIKVADADIGGSPDKPFAQVFAQLAGSYIQDKLPQLTPYQVGFQLLEKNRENTKAAGTFVYKLGEYWLLVPVFYLNGNLRGYEMAWIKNSDLFIPTMEKWINYIIGKNQPILGEAVKKDYSSLGIVQPYLRQLSTPPYKYSSVIKKASEQLTAIANGKDVAETSEALQRFFLKYGRYAAEKFLKMFRNYPIIIKAMDEFHPGLLDKAATIEPTIDLPSSSDSLPTVGLASHTVHDDNRGSKKRKKSKKIEDENEHKDEHEETTTKESAAGKNRQLLREYRRNNTVIRYGTKLAQVLWPTLTESEREKLLQDGYIIKTAVSRDDRIEVIPDIPWKLRNPDRTGIYAVLTKGNKFEECLVAFTQRNTQDNFDCVIVRLKDKQWQPAISKNIWVFGDNQESDYRDFYNRLPKVSELKERERPFIILTELGKAIGPFEIVSKFDDDPLAFEIRDCYCSSYAGMYSTNYLVDTHNNHHRFSSRGPKPIESGNKDILIVNKYPSARLKLTRDGYIVPAHCRVLLLKSKESIERSIDNDEDPDLDELRPLHIGNAVDFRIHFTEGTLPVTIKKVSDKKYVIDNEVPKETKEAKLRLIEKYDIAEKWAEYLLKKADEDYPNTSKWRVIDKRAQATRFGAIPGSLAAEDISAPVMPISLGEGNVAAVGPDATAATVRTPFVDQQVIPDLAASNTDPNIYNVLYPDPKAVQLATQAYQTGQKELFDTSVLGELLKVVDVEDATSRYIEDIIRAMDRVGRMLFLLYWHADDFADKYGKSSLLDLEERLRNTFETLGELSIMIIRRGNIDRETLLRMMQRE